MIALLAMVLLGAILFAIPCLLFGRFVAWLFTKMFGRP